MKEQKFVFSKKNYLLMAAGIGIMVIGYLLMVGGANDNPDVFNEEVFHPRRIVWAPILVVLGVLVEVLAIMLPRKEDE